MMSSRLELKQGALLFKEGDKPDYAYLIESGQIEVQANQNGEILILGVLNPGDLLGEMAVLDNEVRSAGAIAKTDCTLIKIDKDQFMERLIKSDPVIRSLLVGLLRRYRSTLSTLKGTEEVERFADTNIFDRITIDKIKLEGQLRAAISNNSLDVRYQPLLNVETNKIAGYEALIRWDHPERGHISPQEFVSLAEETSLILEVGEYVIDTACAAVKAFIDNGAEPKPFIAVNISARQLTHPDLIERIVERVKLAGLPRDSIKIEITEGLALESSEVQNTINLCHQHGMKVALDDFGTGYSNMTLLHKLGFDTIKIDQAFSRGMTVDDRSMILVDSIVSMCNALEADVLVEGVETEVMLDILRTLGCKYAQGFYIGKPQTLQELIEKI